MGEERSAACALISDGSLPRGPCFSRLFTNTLSLGGLRITAHRSRQAKIITQHRSLIFGTEQTARLQFRYHLIDKLVQPDRQMGRLNQKAVNRAVLEPSRPSGAPAPRPDGSTIGDSGAFLRPPQRCGPRLR